MRNRMTTQRYLHLKRTETVGEEYLSSITPSARTPSARSAGKEMSTDEKIATHKKW